MGGFGGNARKTARDAAREARSRRRAFRIAADRRIAQRLGIAITTLEREQDAYLDAIDIAIERQLPDLYILDQSGRVIFARSDVNAREREKTQALPAEIEPIVLDIMKRRTLEAQDRVFVDRTVSRIVHMTRLNGERPGHVAVFISPFRVREDISAAAKKYGLTKREAQVVRLLAAGTRTQEIAQEMQIKASTVALHVKSAMSKTQAHSRVELVMRAFSVHGKTRGMRREDRR